jgi:Helix-turn-helix of DDE superfamily endonuclease
MKWNVISKLDEKKFRHYTGIYRAVYEKMLEQVRAAKAQARKHPTKGTPNMLSIEDQLLVTVMFWREYRDQQHLAVDFGVHQSTISRAIHETETILIQSRHFSLPGRKSLRTLSPQYEVVIVDVTETPVERPKKNKNESIAAKRNVIP